MATAVNHKHSLTRLMGTIRHDGTVESSTDNEKVIFECRIQNAKFKIKIKNFYANANLAIFRPLYRNNRK